MAKRKQKQVEKSGPMAGHVRLGRRYLSPIAATGVLTIGDWVRDDLPDLIWPIMTLAELGTDSGAKFVRWQERVQSDLKGEVSPQLLADGLDGRLTSLDRLVAELPGAAEVTQRHAKDLGIISDSTVAILASYPRRPAPWFVPRSFESIDQSGIDRLAKAMLEVLSDGHRHAIVKCLWVWSAVQAGVFHSSSETIDLLRPYPNDLATRPIADTAIRAMWGAHRLLISEKHPERFAASIQWAKVFWGCNSMTSNCIRQTKRDELGGQGAQTEDKDVVQAEAEPSSEAAGTTVRAETPSSYSSAAIPPGAENLRQLAMDLLSSYFEALETSPSRLYDVELHEVNTGLVTRAGREVVAALGAPDLWGMENGSHVIRILVEARIYVEWMAKQDPSIYARYKSFGQGKAKLYARISRESRTDDEFPGLDEAIEEFRKLSHDDEVLEHQTVDTSDSFSEKSIRAMADECGLLDLYRRTYSIASGVSHSEWWSIETHCMEQCMNVLHRGHLIPSLSLPEQGNAAMARAWLDSLYGLIWRSLQIQGANRDAVDQAFSWLRGDPNAPQQHQ